MVSEVVYEEVIIETPERRCNLSFFERRAKMLLADIILAGDNQIRNINLAGSYQIGLIDGRIEDKLSSLIRESNIREKVHKVVDESVEEGKEVMRSKCRSYIQTIVTTDEGYKETLEIASKEAVEHTKKVSSELEEALKINQENQGRIAHLENSVGFLGISVASLAFAVICSAFSPAK